MQPDFNEIYLDILCSKTKNEFVYKMMNFCEFSYDKLINKLKKVHFDKNRMDFALIKCIEDINKEINEIVKKINNSEIVINQDKIAINLLYGLIFLNDTELWNYYNQKYLTFYN
jgi:hypothetical protein